MTALARPELSEPQPEAVIEVHKVCKQFDKSEPTVREISFEVQKGRIFCLHQGRLLAFGTPAEVRQHVMGGGIINITLEEVTAQALR